MIPAMLPHLRSIFRIGLMAMGLTTSVSAQAAEGWPDTPLGRAEALAALQSLNAALLGHDSATLTLDTWCADHKLAPAGSRIVAERVRGADKLPTAEDRERLHADGDEPVRYRRVRLLCGARVLSEADNWYVPSRLTPAMNVALDTTDGAFGRVVQPLHFRRQTLGARLLWSPLPVGWDTGAAVIPQARPGSLPVPDAVLEHRAILVLPDGTPFSEVVETYTGQVLDFAPPRSD